MRKQWSEVFFSILLVVGMGYFTLSPPQQKSLNPTQSHWQLEDARSPASLTEQDSHLDQEVTKTGYLFIQQSLCRAKNQDYIVQYEYVRLVLGFCASASLQQITVVNTTNGYSANIFPSSARQMTTDYIALVPGKNIIQVEHFLDNGEVQVSTFTVDQKT